jgi:hypothetical protein
MAWRTLRMAIFIGAEEAAAPPVWAQAPAAGINSNASVSVRRFLGIW